MMPMARRMLLHQSHKEHSPSILLSQSFHDLFTKSLPEQIPASFSLPDTGFFFFSRFFTSTTKKIFTPQTHVQDE